ncbi:MAG: ABC transporter permease [Christensenellales bacterium]|jgi:ribose transport system permease protein
MAKDISKRENWFQRNWKNNPLFSTGIALIVMIVLQTVALGFDFASFGDWLAKWTQNWINILRNNSNVGMIALGMTLVIISGGIDLAVGSTLVGVGALVMTLIDSGGWFAANGFGGVPMYIAAVLIALIFGALLGEINGVVITKGRVPPFIATLGAMKIIRSVTQHFTQNASPKVPKEFLNIARFKIGDQILLPIFYWLLLAAILYVITRYTAFGRHVYAVGSNERTTRLSGIDVDRVKRRVYALMGFIVALSSVIQVARIGSMDYANAGSGYELDAIAAVIVGGTSMAGGRGSIIGTVLGMLIIAVMNNLLNLIGVPAFLREAFKGAIVIFAVLMQRKEKA